MSDWSPSSDDGSEEMEGMRVKLASMQKGGRKRLNSWIQDDDDTNKEESDSNSTRCKRKKSKVLVQDDTSEVSSDLFLGSFEAEHPTGLSSCSPCPSPLPPTASVEFSTTDPRNPEPLNSQLSLSSPPSSAGVSVASRTEFSRSGGGKKERETRNAPDGEQDVRLEDFEEDLYILNDHVLEEVFAQMETETFHHMATAASAKASPTSATCRNEIAAPQVATESSSTFPSDDTATPQDHEITTPARHVSRNEHNESRYVRQAEPHEEEWIDDYIQQEQDDQTVRTATRPLQKPSTTQGITSNYEETSGTRDVSSSIPFFKDFQKTRDEELHDVPGTLDNDEDQSLKELLRQQEEQAKGQAPVSDFVLPPESIVANFGSEQFSQAFGLSPERTDMNTESPSYQDDSFLEIPSRSDDQQTPNDGIERDERYPEVDPARYPLPMRGNRPAPMVHYFTSQSHPPQGRQRLPVVNVFDKPQIAKFFTQKYENFNTMQSQVANMLAHSDDHLVLAAPTGAGKTAIFEMAMARFFGVDLQSRLGGNDCPRPRQNLFHQVSNRRKIVYMSPSKALCEERFDDWTNRLAQTKMGIEVATVTGDGDPGESFRDVASANIILTTPEKWDSLTRRWTENFFLLASVKLVLIDEVHLLADQSRGPCIESVINRLKSIQHVAENTDSSHEEIMSSSYVNTSPEAIASPMRIVAVSATLPNISEIAEFLTANEAFVFDESFRPVPLTTHVMGLGNPGQNSFQFWNGLDREVPTIVERFSEGRPTIVFCHSKAETERLADTLAKCPGIGQKGQQDIASRTRVAKLQRVLYCGIGYHHAGLELDDRRHVEKSFALSKIRVLVTTSTLAMGVNLPAHLVIVKGTKAWRGSNGYQDLDQASLLQMIGRAGRPGYDNSGTAVIMTETKSKSIFERMASTGLSPAKSQLLNTFEEILAPELSQRVITDMNSAMNWIKSTLYYVQVKRDPSSHNVPVVSEHSVDTYFHGILREGFRKLQQIGVVALREGSTLKPFDGCYIMSQHLVDFSTMKIFSELPFDVNQRGMLQAVCQVERLQRPAKRSEKKTLNALHKDVRYKLEGAPSKVRVQQPWEKAFVLLQASIERRELDDYTLRSESVGMCDFASRMLSAAEEIGARATKNGQVVVHSLKLRRSIATSLWDHNGVLGQFSSLNNHVIKSLEFHGVKTFDDVLNATAESLEKAASCTAPFGSDLKNAVQRVVAGALKIEAKVISHANGSPRSVLCNLRAIGDSSESRQPSSGETPDVTYTVVAYTDRPNGCLLYKRNVSKPEIFEFSAPPRFGKITIRLVASIVGLDDAFELPGNDEIYRTFAPVAKKKKAKKQKNASSALPPEAPSVRVSQGRCKRKSTGSFQVTPSPKLNQSITNRPAAARQRDGTIEDFLSAKPAAAQRVSTQQSTKKLSTAVQQRDSIIADFLAAKPIAETDLQQHKASKHASTHIVQPASSEEAPTTETPQLQEQGITSLSVRRRASPTFQKQSFGEHPPPRLTQATTAPVGVENPRSMPIGNSRRPVQIRRAPAQPERPFRANNAPVPRSSHFASQHHDAPQHVSSRQSQVDQSPHDSSFRSPPATTTAWKQTRRTIERNQKRVFRHNENLFAGFQHDPNDSEAMLDLLSQKTTPTRNSPASGVIPLESQRAVDKAYRTTFARKLQTTDRGKSQQGSRGKSRQHRRFLSKPVVNETSLLAQKASEQEMYASGPFHSPASSEYWGHLSQAQSEHMFLPGEGDLPYHEPAPPAVESFTHDDDFAGHSFAPTLSGFFSHENQQPEPYPDTCTTQDPFETHHYSHPHHHHHYDQQDIASSFGHESFGNQSPPFASQLHDTRQSPYLFSQPTTDYQSSFTQRRNQGEDDIRALESHAMTSHSHRGAASKDMGQFENAFFS